MTDGIAYFIAGSSILVLLAIWFINAYRVLSLKKEEVMQADAQVRLLQDGLRQLPDGSDVQAAKKMIETSRQIYLQIENNYNEALQKPLYYLPCILMRFRELHQK